MSAHSSSTTRTTLATVCFTILIFLTTCCNTTFSKKATTSLTSPYHHLANYLHSNKDYDNDDGEETNILEKEEKISSLVKHLKSLSKSQSTFKNIDGASHEFYQRSHTNKDKMNDNDGTMGRAQRTANRIGACADALFGCELLDGAFLDVMVHDLNDDDEGGVGLVEEDLDVQKRSIIFNSTVDDPDLSLEVVVMFERGYNGGVGIDHGGINGLTLDQHEHENGDRGHDSGNNPRGRYFILIRDKLEQNLEQSLQVLDEDPAFVELSLGLVSGEVVGVNPILYDAAAKVLNLLNENGVLEFHSRNNDDRDADADEGDDIDVKTIDTNNESNEDKKEENDENEFKEQKGKDTKSSAEKASLPQPAIHIVGRSLAGGVATLSALMLDGSIPMPIQQSRQHGGRRKKKHKRRSHSSSSSSSSTSTKRQRSHHAEGPNTGRRKSKKQKKSSSSSSSSNHKKGEGKSTSLHGYGKLRTSAVVLGAPPSISANIKASYITSILNGDDILPRTTKRSLDTLRSRITKTQNRNIFTKQMGIGRLSDTLSLAASSLKSHAHGSEGEEERLVAAGNAFLIRPRRIAGGVSSIHEIGNTGGREALRAAVLWQLNDILLSRSMWKHHSFEAYIHGLDKVQLRQVASDDDDTSLEEEVYHERTVQV